nr:uncharacterized protein LOC112785945 [Arachis hypogaea]
MSKRVGYEKETKGEVDWSYDWVNDDVRDRVSLFLDVGAVNEIDKSKVVRVNSGVRLELLPCTVKGVWKGGWVNLNSSSGFGVFKLYKLSFKNFKEMYLNVGSCEDDFLFYVDEHLGKNFPLWWCSEPQNILGPETISPKDECIIEFLTEVVDRKELISVYALLQWEENKAAVIDYLGGKYPGVSAASLRSQVKSKGLDKEVSSSKANKVGVGEVDQPRPGRRKVIAKKRKGDVVDLSDVSDDEKDDVPMEEVHKFCDNQKRLHGFVERSEGSSLWRKDYPFMITADEVCQTPSDVSLVEEVGDVAIDQYMQVVGLRLASLGRSREKIHRKLVEKKEDPSLRKELAIKVAKVSELEVKLVEVEKHLKEVKESYAKDVEDLKKKEADLSSMSTRVIEVTARLKEVEKNK